MQEGSLWSLGREERRGDANRITPGGFTPRSAARTIRDDTRGTPSAFRPWTNCRPRRGRCAHEENARVFHQGPDTSVVHREAGYINAALHVLVHRVTHRRCTEGWVHISFCAKNLHKRPRAVGSTPTRPTKNQPLTSRNPLPSRRCRRRVDGWEAIIFLPLPPLRVFTSSRFPV